MQAPACLDEATFAEGLRSLSDRDCDLGRIVDELGFPPMWMREPGFPTLVRIILEQQVSLASARAAYERLLNSVEVLTPERFLRLDGATLKRIGFSRQKAAYCNHLASAIAEGTLKLDTFAMMEDNSVRRELMKIRGIGTWTADIYLLMALRRPDAWTSKDLALAVAVQRVKGLQERPSSEELDCISEMWRPWRAVAARILWHFYLTERRKKVMESQNGKAPLF